MGLKFRPVHSEVSRGDVQETAAAISILLEKLSQLNLKDLNHADEFGVFFSPGTRRNAV